MKATLILLTAVMITFFSSTGCISSSTVNADKPGYFPVVTGTDLHGNDQTFPECLTKDKTIMVVAFQRWQQELCDEWYAAISKYLEKDENSAFYEVPTISEMNGFSRWFIHNGMKGGIKDEVMRGQVVTLHIDKEPFKKALQIETEDTVHVYIVGKDGKLLKYIPGRFEAAKWTELLNVLEGE